MKTKFKNEENGEVLTQLLTLMQPPSATPSVSFNDLTL
jgi:hypothetical protein